MSFGKGSQRVSRVGGGVVCPPVEVGKECHLVDMGGRGSVSFSRCGRGAYSRREGGEQ